MNIDFHYGIIYAVARLGGLGSADAKTVAHACQYVDDATTDGLLKFKGGESFERFASAHDMADYRNAEDDKNRKTWVPFHFLPGVIGSSLEERAVCRPNSAVAQDMVRRALTAREAPNALHRLGVTLHVYVDTWAHQGFSGMVSDFNRLTHLEGDGHDPQTWLEKLKHKLVTCGQDFESFGIDAVSGLGHGAALHFPDMPWAEWQYRNKVSDAFIQRRNLPDFVEAANMACKVVQAFAAKTISFDTQQGLKEDAEAAITELMQLTRSHNPTERLQAVGEAIASGHIPGLRESFPEYIPKGPGSWKHVATGIEALEGDGDTAPAWSSRFEDSDYRKFHDATKEHRFVVVQEILPNFGLRLT